MAKPIDWTRPCYRVRTYKRGNWHDPRCAECSTPIEVGDLYRAGPRGRLLVHARCVASPAEVAA